MADPAEPITTIAVSAGFIGLGSMGGPMAANLATRVESLTVHDVRRESAAALLEAGAHWADDLETISKTSSTVFLSLPRPRDVETVIAGPGGLIEHLAPGSMIVDLSTNSPTVVRQLATAAAAREITLLDAPVSGGTMGARRGTLTLMVGGTREGFTRVLPLLEIIGSKIVHLGEAGAGSIAKLLNNMLFLNGVLGTVEALVLGARAGVDLQLLREVVQSGSGGSFAWEFGTRAIMMDRLAPNFAVGLASKDADLAIELAADFDSPYHLGALVGERFREFVANGLGDRDVFDIVAAFEEATGTIVRGTWRHES